MKPLLAPLLAASLFAAIVLSATFAHAANAVPFVNQPLVPASVAPGGAGFMLTVNGTGFVSGSTVNWNGSPRTTTFVSGSQVTAAILSSDIATATTASVTVVSPAPGRGTSNVVFLPVRESSTFVSLNSSSFDVPLDPGAFAIADFNKDGEQDMAIVSSGTEQVLILLGNGDGTFSQGSEYSAEDANAVIAADLSSNGNADLAVAAGNGNVFVMLGNGDCTFQKPVEYSGNGGLSGIAAGDFNRDGMLDLAVVGSGEVCIFLGSGNGILQPPNCTTVSNSTSFYSIAVGDFNADGNLDLALPSASSTGNAVYILLGNGDGTFRAAQTYPSGGYATSLTTADFNGDGKLDLAVILNNNNAVSVLLGNGDGSFQPPTSFATALSPDTVVAADMNGDGNLDLIASSGGFNGSSTSILLGNGDGTFQSHVDYDGFIAYHMGVADFNGDGKLDVAVSNYTPSTVTILLQDDGTVVSLSPNKAGFPTQLVGTVSQPKPIKLTNTGTTALTISNITIDTNFSQLSNCKTVQPGGSCRVAVYFTPTTTGNLTGYPPNRDNGGGNPQIINLSGVATIVSLAPSSLNFGDQKVGTVSKSQNVVLTNEGNSNLDITKIGIGGADPADFSEVNACASKIAAGGSCTITVLFHPNAQGSRSAILEVEDNGGGSPQKVPLTGTGT